MGYLIVGSGIYEIGYFFYSLGLVKSIFILALTLPLLFIITWKLIELSPQVKKARRKEEKLILAREKAKAIEISNAAAAKKAAENFEAWKKAREEYKKLYRKFEKEKLEAKRKQMVDAVDGETKTSVDDTAMRQELIRKAKEEQERSREEYYKKYGSSVRSRINPIVEK
jgi:hypothetical protein